MTALVFGPAGLLRERIEHGDMPDLFLSANMEHPAALAAARGDGKIQSFARNSLVAVARRKLGLPCRQAAIRPAHFWSPGRWMCS
ncbi:MAG TPA: substrate-binding domain-containing protein [Acetobacteraceae bacterium]|jgi:molybdate transport system substrate-binding protein